MKQYYTVLVLAYVLAFTLDSFLNEKSQYNKNLFLNEKSQIQANR